LQRLYLLVRDPSLLHLRGLAQREKATVDGIVGSGNKTGLIGGEKQGKVCNLFWIAHTADGLRSGEFLHHLRLPAGVVVRQETVDERRMHPRWRDTVAANVEGQTILGDRKRHCQHSTLGHRVSKAVTQSATGCDGGHVEYYACVALHHQWNRGLHGEVSAADVDPIKTIKVERRSGQDRADMCDTRAVD